MKKWGWGSFYGNSLLVHTKKIYSKSIAVSRVPLPERETDLHKLANIALALPGFRATEAMLFQYNYYHLVSDTSLLFEIFGMLTLTLIVI